MPGRTLTPPRGYLPMSDRRLSGRARAAIASRIEPTWEHVMMTLEPTEELVQITPRYSWELPLKSAPSKNADAPRGNVRSVWYIGLPLTSAHRGSHSGGGA